MGPKRRSNQARRPSRLSPRSSSHRGRAVPAQDRPLAGELGERLVEPAEPGQRRHQAVSHAIPARAEQGLDRVLGRGVRRRAVNQSWRANPARS